MSFTPIVPKHAKLGEGFSPLDQYFSGSDPNRPSGMLAGTWVDDFVALRKMIMLCPHCLHKFNPKRHHYEIWRRDLYSFGKCDDCNQHTPYLKSFIHESTHTHVGEWHAPKKGRWARS
jgi:hypothetical protein